MSLSTLIRDDRLLAEAIEAADPLWLAELPASAGAAAAAGAIVAGLRKRRELVPALMKQLGEDGLPGLAAAWALAELGAEDAVRAALPEGRLDLRQNGYTALAGIAARGAASPTLPEFLGKRVPAELERARSGGTGLADQALKGLGVLGIAGFADLVQQVIDQDRFCDRFELDRLRKQVADRGKATDLIKDLLAPWQVVFADHLVVAKAEAASQAAAGATPLAAGAPANPLAPPNRLAPASKLAPASTSAPAGRSGPPPAGSLDDATALDEQDGPGAFGAEGADGPLSPEEAAAAAAKQIDWKTFSESPEFTALHPQSQGLVGQLGPVLESLAAQAIRAYLADLSGKEFAALLLQVLPQALPPQHVQMALHPHALNGYQALARFLERTGTATNGADLVEGVKQVRKALQAQMKRSGILGGPDYTDPDELVKG